MNPSDFATQLSGSRIAAYVRVSDDIQDEQRQVVRIDEWCEKHDVEVSKWFIDNEGRNPRDKAEQREKFQQMFKEIESGRLVVTAVLVAEQDRFGVSDHLEFGFFCHRLRRQDVSLWSVSEGDLTNPDNDYVAITTTMGAQKSRSEQKKTSERVITSQKRRAKKGFYHGGYAPFGTDVVCFKDGVEIWRVHFDGGHHRRVKIIGDERIRYDGKDNFPSRDYGDVLRLRRTVDEDRIETLQMLYSWYVTEEISPTQIATRLRELKRSACFGDWNKQKVKEILRNPAAIGYPAFNKRAGSRFHELLDGEIRPVTAKVAGRTRKEADWVKCEEQQYEPLVDPELYYAAQERLLQQSKKYGKKKKSPRKALFWLRNLLVCWKCGKEMRIRSQNNGAYFCATYGTYGKSNPTECRCHAISKRVIEKLVDDYLIRTHEQTAELIEAQQNQDAEYFASLEAQVVESCRLLGEAVDQLQANLRNNPDIREAHREIDAQFWRSDRSVDAVLRLLRARFQLSKEAHADSLNHMETCLSELQKDHDRLLDQLGRLDPDMAESIKQTKSQIRSVESQKDTLRQQMEGEVERIRSYQGELTQRVTSLKNAKETVSDELGYRRKAKLVGEIVEKIVVEFAYSDTTAANQPKSVPSKVTIIPFSGSPEKVCFPNGPSPAKD